MKICNVPTAYVLLNSDLGSDESIIADIKRILSNEGVIMRFKVFMEYMI